MGASGFLAEEGVYIRVGLRTLGTGTTRDSGAVGLGLARGTNTGAGAAGAGAISTLGAGAGAVGAAPVSTSASVCATTSPLLRTLRPPIRLNPCISGGHR